jgi:hypothetical protein
LEFASRAIDALAWPAAAVVLGLLFRPALRELLSGPSLTRVKVGPGGLEAEWDRELNKTRRSVEHQRREVAESNQAPQSVPSETPTSFQRDMRELMERASPIAAVAASHTAVDAELRTVLRKSGIEPPSVSTAELAHLAYEQGLVSASTRDAIEGLGNMRMLAVMDEGARRLDQRHAMEFVSLAEAVLFALRYETREQ